jgi:hypothetical protein
LEYYRVEYWHYKVFSALVLSEALFVKGNMSDSVPQHALAYSIAGITIQIQADLPITKDTFAPGIQLFQVQGVGEDIVSIHHHFSLPDLSDLNLGQEVYRKPPWAIYRDGDNWIYLGIAPDADDPSMHMVAFFNKDHTRGRIHHPDGRFFLKGNFHPLSMFPTDQILLARVLADRQACYLHAAGMVLDGKGLLFVGHSTAGKSTMVKLLRGEGEILCDDRMIVRRWSDGFRIHGTWSHGEIPHVSPADAPLRAILLLEKAHENRLIPLENHSEIVRRLPFFVIKPLVTSDWWQKILDLVGQIAQEVPVYRLLFDKSGAVKQVLKENLLT